MFQILNINEQTKNVFVKDVFEGIIKFEMKYLSVSCDLLKFSIIY